MMTGRSEEHTSELQSRVDISYAVFCLKKRTHGRGLHDRFGRRVVGGSGTTGRAGSRRGDREPQDRDAIGQPHQRAQPLRFFFNDTATTEIYTLSLHDALPICSRAPTMQTQMPVPIPVWLESPWCRRSEEHTSELQSRVDISYAVFCLKKK